MRLSFFYSNSLKILASWVHARRRWRASVHSLADPTNPDRVEPSGIAGHIDALKCFAVSAKV